MMYINIESLYYTPETDTMLYVNFILYQNKLSTCHFRLAAYPSLLERHVT